MSLMDGVRIDIGLNASPFSNGVRQAKSEVVTFEDTIKRVGRTIAGVFGVMGVGATMRQNLQAWNQQEWATKQLEIATARWAKGNKEVKTTIETLADEMQKLTGISDETWESVGTMGLNMGIAATKIRDATKAAGILNLVFGYDTNSMMRNLAKTTAGLTGELGEMLPFLRELSAEELKNGAAIDLVIEKYGDYAEMLSGTSKVATDRFKAALGDVSEMLGKRLAPVVGKAADWIEGFSDSVEKNGSILGALKEKLRETWNNMGTLGKTVIGLAGAFLALKTAGAAWTLLSKIVGTGAVVIDGAFRGIFSWPAIVAGAIYLLRVAWIKDWFNIRKAVGNTWDTLKDVFAWMKERTGSAWDWTVNFVSDVKDWTIDSVRNVWSWLETTYNKVVSWTVNFVPNIATAAYETAVNVGAWVIDTSGKAIKWTVDFVSDIAIWAFNAARGIGQWIADKTSKAVEWTINLFSDLAKWDGSVENIWNWLVDVTDKAVSWFVGFAGKIPEATVETAKMVWNWLSGVVSKSVSWVVSTAGNFWSWIANTAVPSAISAMFTVRDWITGASSKTISWVVEGMGNIWEWITDTAWPSTMSALTNLGGFIKDATTKTVNWFLEIGGTVWDWITGKSKAPGPIQTGKLDIPGVVTVNFDTEGIQTFLDGAILGVGAFGVLALTSRVIKGLKTWSGARPLSVPLGVSLGVVATLNEINKVVAGEKSWEEMAGDIAAGVAAAFVATQMFKSPAIGFLAYDLVLQINPTANLGNIEGGNDFSVQGILSRLMFLMIGAGILKKGGLEFAKSIPLLIGTTAIFDMGRMVIAGEMEFEDALLSAVMAAFLGAGFALATGSVGVGVLAFSVSLYIIPKLFEKTPGELFAGFQDTLSSSYERIAGASPERRVLAYAESLSDVRGALQKVMREEVFSEFSEETKNTINMVSTWVIETTDLLNKVSDGLLSSEEALRTLENLGVPVIPDIISGVEKAGHIITNRPLNIPEAIPLVEEMFKEKTINEQISATETLTNSIDELKKTIQDNTTDTHIEPPWGATTSKSYLDSILKDYEPPDKAPWTIKQVLEAIPATSSVAEAIVGFASYESDFRPWARSSKGAQGIMQLMPDTVKDIERILQLPKYIEQFGTYAELFGDSIDPYDAKEGIIAASVYLEWLQDTLKAFKEEHELGATTTRDLVGAYNAGIGTWQDVLLEVSEMPEETAKSIKKFSKAMMDYQEEIAKQASLIEEAREKFKLGDFNLSFDIPTSYTPEYQTGGYTSNIGENQIAGVVHGGEWVAPKWMLDNPFYASIIKVLELSRKGYSSGISAISHLNEKIGGFQAGGFVVPKVGAELSPTIKTWQDYMKDVLNVMGEDFAWLTGLLTDMVNKIFPEFDVAADALDALNKDLQDIDMSVKDLDTELTVVQKSIRKFGETLSKASELFTYDEETGELGTSEITSAFLNDASSLLAQLKAKITGTAVAPINLGVQGEMTPMATTDFLVSFAMALGGAVLQLESLQKVLNPFSTLIGGILSVTEPVISGLAPLGGLIESLGYLIGSVLIPVLKPWIDQIGYASIVVTWFIDKFTLGIDTLFTWLDSLPIIGNWFNPILSEEQRQEKGKSLEERFKDYQEKTTPMQSTQGETFMAGSSQQITYNNSFDIHDNNMIASDSEIVRSLGDMIIENLRNRGITLVVGEPT